MFEIGNKIRCVDATYSDERLTFGKIYTLLGYNPKYKDSTFEVEDDNGYRSWWKEGRFVKTFEVGNRVKCVDQRLFSFPKVGEFYEVMSIDNTGNIALKDKEGFCTNCTYPQEMFVKVEEESMPEFKVGDRAKQIKWVKQEENPYVTITKVQGEAIYHTHDSGEKSCSSKESFILIKEATMFKVGDRVGWNGHTGTIVKVKGNDATTTLWDKDSTFDGKSLCVDFNLWKQFKKIGEIKMSKYQELKERIENVKGWDKETDDILREMKFFGKSFYIAVCTDTSLDVLSCDKYSLVNFRWSTQCEKLEAFKKALLYLLDHSDIKKDEREEKIKEIEKERDELASRIGSLNLKIEELRR